MTNRVLKTRRNKLGEKIDTSLAKIEKAEEGYRNTTLFVEGIYLISYFRDMKLDINKLIDDLREAALKSGLAEEEINATLDSAINKVDSQIQNVEKHLAGCDYRFDSLHTFLMQRIEDLNRQLSIIKERETRIYISGELMAYQTIGALLKC